MGYACVVIVPMLHTERLTLRRHALEDFEDAVAVWADPAVTRFIGGRPFTRQETWTKLLRYVGHWELLGYGYWAVVETATGRFVGEVGFADFRRVIDPPIDGSPEAGWVLAPWAHGRGYATEAVSAAIAWGADHFTAPRTVCLIDPGNRASIRVAQKCGYRPYVETTYAGEPTIIFERLFKP